MIGKYMCTCSKGPEKFCETVWLDPISCFPSRLVYRMSCPRTRVCIPSRGHALRNAGLTRPSEHLSSRYCPSRDSGPGPRWFWRLPRGPPSPGKGSRQVNKKTREHRHFQMLIMATKKMREACVVCVSREGLLKDEVE